MVRGGAGWLGLPAAGGRLLVTLLRGGRAPRVAGWLLLVQYALSTAGCLAAAAAGRACVETSICSSSSADLCSSLISMRRSC